MDAVQKREAARVRRAAERLGVRAARCPYCGEADPRCLELHHIAGRKFADDLVPVCRNCHRKLSDMQRDHPRPIGDDPHWMERAGHLLLGLADLLLLAVEKLKTLALLLLDKARSTQPAGSQIGQPAGAKP
jgi:DNA-directed RNA polymerase subunit RPC12/RpoP